MTFPKKAYSGRQFLSAVYVVLIATDCVVIVYGDASGHICEKHGHASDYIEIDEPDDLDNDFDFMVMDKLTSYHINPIKFEEDMYALADLLYGLGF